MIQSITSPLRIPVRETAGTIAAAIADNDRQWVERIELYAEKRKELHNLGLVGDAAMK